MKQAPFTAKRWRVAYQRAVDVGAFDGEPIELALDVALLPHTHPGVCGDA